MRRNETFSGFDRSACKFVCLVHQYNNFSKRLQVVTDLDAIEVRIISSVFNGDVSQIRKNTWKNVKSSQNSIDSSFDSQEKTYIQAISKVLVSSRDGPYIVKWGNQ